MSRSLSRGQALLLGTVVLGSFALGLGGLFAIHDRAGWSSQSFRVQVGFPDIQGVEIGSRVRVQGIDAGEVEALVPPERPGEPVKLRLRLARKYHHLVGADARVQIVSENLLAGKLVRVLPGSAQAAPVAEGGELTALVQPDLLDGLAESAAKLNRTLGKAEDLLARVEKGEGTLGKLLRDETLHRDLTTVLARVQRALDDVESGQGTVGRLVKSNEAYAEALSSLQDVRRMVASVKQNADAIKSLPVVRSYVVDPHKELARPDCRRLRRFFAESEVFEPGKAVLTTDGRKLLDDAAGWLNDHKEVGSEVVVAAFAGPSDNPDFTQTLTQRQSEVASDYLRGQHRIHRTGWWWWSTRGVRSVGCGSNPSPVPESEPLPPARLELIVFVPIQ
jgi:phospholipid/cholesterol/gamma-HCH transport system substrate-binding protein